jgi:hypothetical protein
MLSKRMKIVEGDVNGGNLGAAGRRYGGKNDRPTL